MYERTMVFELACVLIRIPAHLALEVEMMYVVSGSH
jgi:hypothetical protein